MGETLAVQLLSVAVYQVKLSYGKSASQDESHESTRRDEEKRKEKRRGEERKRAHYKHNKQQKMEGWVCHQLDIINMFAQLEVCVCCAVLCQPVLCQPVCVCVCCDICMCEM